jgi:hypothetical protein
MKIQALSTPINSTENEIKQPYKCYCCRDTGLVSNLHIADYVEGNNPYPFICQRFNCEPGNKFMNAYHMSDEAREAYAKEHNCSATKQRVYQESFDVRLNSEACESMHVAERSAWFGQIKCGDPVAMHDLMEKFRMSTVN